MDELVLQMLTIVQDEKKAAGIGPDVITLGNLTNCIKQSLNRLHTAKKVKVGDTMNDKYITIL